MAAERNDAHLHRRSLMWLMWSPLALLIRSLFSLEALRELARLFQFKIFPDLDVEMRMEMKVRRRSRSQHVNHRCAVAATYHISDCVLCQQTYMSLLKGDDAAATASILPPTFIWSAPANAAATTTSKKQLLPLCIKAIEDAREQFAIECPAIDWQTDSRERLIIKGTESTRGGVIICVENSRSSTKAAAGQMIDFIKTWKERYVSA